MHVLSGASDTAGVPSAHQGFFRPCVILEASVDVNDNLLPAIIFFPIIFSTIYHPSPPITLHKADFDTDI